MSRRLHKTVTTGAMLDWRSLSSVTGARIPVRTHITDLSKVHVSIASQENETCKEEIHTKTLHYSISNILLKRPDFVLCSRPPLGDDDENKDDVSMILLCCNLIMVILI